MPHIKITLEETYEVPEGTVIQTAPTGVVSGLRLPSGDVIKPWITMEHFLNGNEDAEGELSHDELMALDIHPDIDFQRGVEVVDGEVPVDNLPTSS